MLLIKSVMRKLIISKYTQDEDGGGLEKSNMI